MTKSGVVGVKSLTKFTVVVEDTKTGAPLITYSDVIAQTRTEAINKTKQKLTFSAERIA